MLQPLTGYEQTCKPSSVFDSHLSRPHISIRLKPRHGIKYAGPARVKTTPSVSVLHQVGFTWPDGLPPAGELLPRLSILACNEKLRQRFLSVALSLESPPPGVTRHPALRSSDFPRGQDCPRDHLNYSQLLSYHFSLEMSIRAMKKLNRYPNSRTFVNLHKNLMFFNNCAAEKRKFPSLTGF